MQLFATAGSDISKRVGEQVEGSCFLPSSQSQTAGVSLVPAATIAFFPER